MKKLTSILALLLLISLHFACKKNNMPNLAKNEPIAEDSLRILDSLHNINEVIMQQLSSRLGNYEVTCRLKTGTFIPDSTGLNPIAVLIDSFFVDTMVLSLTKNILGDNNPNQFIDKNTIFVSTEHKKHKHTDLFYAYLYTDTIRFGYPQDGYSCKCSGGLRLENDSIFYRSYRLTSFDNTIECSGTKIN